VIQMLIEGCSSTYTPEGDLMPWYCTRPEGHPGLHRAVEYNVEWTEEEADDD
jgi:hypothetical protein